MSVTISSLKNPKTEVKVKAASILWKLIEKNKELQVLAEHYDGVEILSKIVKNEVSKIELPKEIPIGQVQGPSAMNDIIEANDPIIFSDNELSLSESLLYNTLRALSYIVISNDSYLKRVIGNGFYKEVISLLYHPTPKVRSSACLCIGSFSRADKTAKQPLITEHVQSVLCKLLGDKYMEVIENALRALCNLVLECQKEVIQSTDCIKLLVDLSQSKHFGLKQRAIFALKNLLYQVTTDIKKSVITKLSYNKLFEFLNDKEHLIQGLALAIIRNLIYNSKDYVQELLAEGGNNKFLNVIIDKTNAINNEVKTEAIYVICNIAAASEKHKKLVMDDRILGQMVSLLVMD